MRWCVAMVVVLSAPVGYAGPTKHVGKELTKGVKEELKSEQLNLEKAGRDLAQGFFGELRVQLGANEICEGDDRAACVDALVSRFAYRSSRSAALGAAEVAAPWPKVFVFLGGMASGLLIAALVALLVGQRRMRREIATFKPATRMT